MNHMANRSISFIIYGEPTPKGRPRVTKKGAYTPKKTRVAEKSFQAQALSWRPSELFKGPLRLHIEFHRSIPKSFSKKKIEGIYAGEIFPTTKPDLDNLVKLVKDAMNHIFYHDDSQVIELYAKKIYADVPRIDVKLVEIEGN